MTDYRTELINRMKDLRYLLMDKEKYPQHTWKRRKLLYEYKFLQKLLLGEQ